LNYFDVSAFLAVAENMVIVEKRQRLPLFTDFYLCIPSRNLWTTAIGTTPCL